jgi:HTH-type transcriptional regulator / antitoxin HigA
VISLLFKSKKQMDLKTQWFLIESEEEYQLAVDRYSKIKHSKKGSQDHKEKLLLIHLISEYEKANTTLPEIDPVELIKIRMAEFGYKSADLAEIYGDKGTVSKMLNYKQMLSLNMIRKFSKLLHIPAEALIKEYELKGI